MPTSDNGNVLHLDLHPPPVQLGGDCSLWIRSATLDFDDGLWECQVTASDFTTQDALTSQPVRLVVRGKCLASGFSVRLIVPYMLKCPLIHRLFSRLNRQGHFSSVCSGATAAEARIRGGPRAAGTQHHRRRRRPGDGQVHLALRQSAGHPQMVFGWVHSLGAHATKCCQFMWRTRKREL